MSAAFRHFFLAMFNNSDFLPDEILAMKGPRRRITGKTQDQETTKDGTTPEPSPKDEDEEGMPDDQEQEVNDFKEKGASRLMFVRQSLMDISRAELGGDTSFLEDFTSVDGMHNVMNNLRQRATVHQEPLPLPDISQSDEDTFSGAAPPWQAGAIYSTAI
jgi:hypothetical protein